MDRKHFLGLSVVLSLSLLVACGDKTNTQEPPQEPDQSVVQQEQNVQPEEINQKVPVEPKEEVKPEEKSSEDNTLNKDEAVDTSAEANEVVEIKDKSVETKQTATPQDVKENKQQTKPAETQKKNTEQQPPAQQAPEQDTGAVVPGVTVIPPGYTSQGHEIDEDKWAVGRAIGDWSNATEEDVAKATHDAAEALEMGKVHINMMKNLEYGTTK